MYEGILNFKTCYPKYIVIALAIAKNIVKLCRVLVVVACKFLTLDVLVYHISFLVMYMHEILCMIYCA